MLLSSLKKGMLMCSFVVVTFLNGFAQNLKLENEKVLIEVNQKTGRIVKLEFAGNGLTPEYRPDLGQSFRLWVPIPDRSDNNILGAEHMPKSVKLSKDKKSITLVWEKMKGTAGGSYDITFIGVIELQPDGLAFSGSVNNRTPYTVETVQWPYFGDIKNKDRKKEIKWFHYGYAGGLRTFPIYPYFSSGEGYFGIDYPMRQHHTQYGHFGLIQSETDGLYVNYDDSTDKHFVNFVFELKPGWIYSESMNDGRVSDDDSLAGVPNHTEFYVNHFAYVKPNTTEGIKPIQIKPYIGDWHTGALYYRKWLSNLGQNRTTPNWINEVHSWQQIQLLSAEDRPVATYAQLADYCKACADNGVRAIQITGWSEGGQDKYFPSHNIDLLLGTYNDLKQSISKCIELGVKPILFNKYTWTDPSYPRFATELHKYASKDPYGNHQYHPGYQYQTPMQLADINTRRFAPMCPSAEGWRKIALTEFEKSIVLGASGMLYDENQHHGGHSYCFDPNHGHKVPEALFAGDQLLEADFAKKVKSLKPDYLLVGEGIRDLQFKTYHLSYFRINKGYVPIQRYVNPTKPMMIAIMGYNDRATINQALLFNFILSYEPRNFKGKLSEFPQTLEYGKKVDNLRRKYPDYLWSGEFNDNAFNLVELNGKPYNAHSVFINLKNGKKALVIANDDYTKTYELIVKREKFTGELVIVSPEEPNEKPFASDIITLKPLEAVVIIEK